jgi:3-methylcrotonyl-CoA carboxylase beta subunit
MAKIYLKTLSTNIKFTKPENYHNKHRMNIMDNQLDALRKITYRGWGEVYRQRVTKKGRLNSWERIQYISDNNNDILSLGTFSNNLSVFDKFLSQKTAPSSGVVTVITRINKLLVIIISNDNTVASGSWWPQTPEKIIRIQEAALKLKIPIIYLVDCSGLFLPEQKLSFPGKNGAGRIFRMNSLLSHQGVPQIAGVMGDCIAGGGYMPIISDKVYMTESAYMVIAGAALIKGSKGQNISSNDIGGPHIHVHQSNCADFRVPNDVACLNKIRKEVALLGSSSVNYYRNNFEPAAPMHDTKMLSHILPVNPRHSYDIYEVISRILDNSLFLEVISNYGKEIVTGIGRINGLYVGIIGNVQGIIHEDEDKKLGGILYKEGVAKISVFSRSCNDDGIPLIWLQDVAGFDIGINAEKTGLLGYGSSLIYTNSNNTTPMLTLLLRKASGAGYYAMCGLPYQPVLQLCTPLSRLAVMDGKTLTIGAFRTKLDDNFQVNVDDAKRNLIKTKMKSLEDNIERDMNPYCVANNLDVDEIIKVGEIRKYLSYFVEASYQSYGIRRIKNSRIWSIHDINSLLSSNYRVKTSSTDNAENKKSEKVDYKFSDNDIIIRAPMEGIFYTKPSPNENSFISIGQVVNDIETLGLLEVMKNFYPISTGSKKSLKVKKILAVNATSVKKNDILFVLISN